MSNPCKISRSFCFPSIAPDRCINIETSPDRGIVICDAEYVPQTDGILEPKVSTQVTTRSDKAIVFPEDQDDPDYTPDYLDLVVMYAWGENPNAQQYYITRDGSGTEWSERGKMTTVIHMDSTLDPESRYFTPIATLTDEDDVLHVLYMMYTDQSFDGSFYNEEDAGIFYQSFDGETWTLPERILPFDTVRYFQVLNMQEYNGEIYVYYVDDNATHPVDGGLSSPEDSYGMPTIMKLSTQETYTITPTESHLGEAEAFGFTGQGQHFVIDTKGIFYVLIVGYHMEIVTGTDLDDIANWDRHVFHDGSEDSNIVNNFEMGSESDAFFCLAVDPFGTVHLVCESHATNPGGLDLEGLLYLSGAKTYDKDDNVTFAWETAEAPELIIDDADLDFSFGHLSYLIDNVGRHHVTFIMGDSGEYGPYTTYEDDFDSYDPADFYDSIPDWNNHIEYINDGYLQKAYSLESQLTTLELIEEEVDEVIVDKYVNFKSASPNGLGRNGVLLWDAPPTHYKDYKIEVDVKFLQGQDTFYNFYQMPGIALAWTDDGSWINSYGYLLYFYYNSNKDFSTVQLVKKEAGEYYARAIHRVGSARNLTEEFRIIATVKNDTDTGGTLNQTRFQLQLIPTALEYFPSYYYSEYIDTDPLQYTGVKYGLAYSAGGIGANKSFGGITRIKLTDLNSRSYTASAHDDRFWRYTQNEDGWGSEYIDLAVDGAYVEDAYCVVDEDKLYSAFITSDPSFSNAVYFIEWDEENGLSLEKIHQPTEDEDGNTIDPDDYFSLSCGIGLVRLK